MRPLAYHVLVTFTFVPGNCYGYSSLVTNITNSRDLGLILSVADAVHDWFSLCFVSRSRCLNTTYTQWRNVDDCPDVT